MIADLKLINFLIYLIGSRYKYVPKCKLCETDCEYIKCCHKVFLRGDHRNNFTCTPCTFELYLLRMLCMLSMWYMKVNCIFTVHVQQKDDTKRKRRRKVRTAFTTSFLCITVLYYCVIFQNQVSI